MRGFYNVYGDGELLASYNNFITDGGKEIIGRYISGEIGSWADSLAIGANNSEPSNQDLRLGLEFWRDDIDLKYYNKQNNTITLRSIIPATVTGKIYETGIYHINSGATANKNSSIALYFDNTSESWEIPSECFFCGLSFRVGKKALVYVNNNNTVTAKLNFVGDFLLYDPAKTTFYLSYEVIQTESIQSNYSSINIKLKANDNNYREYTVTSINQSGYTTHVFNRNDFDVVGEPTWTDFSSVEVSATGTGRIALDALSIRDEVPGEDTILVSRAIIPNNGFIQKNESQELQIEYVLDIN